MFQRLLVAIDGTEGSDVTLSFASALAHQCDGTVHVLYVNEFAVGSRGIPVRTDEEATGVVVEAVKRLRAEGVRACGSVRRAPYRRVADRIAVAAEAFSADAIVLGSQRNRRIGRMFARRVRERTLRLTVLPVIAAPAPLELPSNAHFGIDEVMRAQREKRPSLSA
jgi:nucleotide-binding universal stress UspA family protein